MTYFDYFKILLFKVGIINHIFINNKNNYNEIKNNGFTNWYSLNDKLHRLDGPAAEHFNGSKWWWQNGKLHRLDGPAEECPDGTKSWWIEGKQVDCESQEEFERYLKLKLFW
jgi:hypothetical protein